MCYIFHTNNFQNIPKSRFDNRNENIKVLTKMEVAIFEYVLHLRFALYRYHAVFIQIIINIFLIHRFLQEMKTSNIYFKYKKYFDEYFELKKKPITLLYGHVLSMDPLKISYENLPKGNHNSLEPIQAY